jgi:hypothetical protein
VTPKWKDTAALLATIALTVAASAFITSKHLAAQSTTHSVTLAWLDNLNPTGTTYTVYRATGLCSGTPTFAKIAAALATKTYQDTTVTPGNYCYTITATVNSIESAQSPTVQPTVPSFAATNVSFTVAQKIDVKVNP